MHSSRLQRKWSDPKHAVEVEKLLRLREDFARSSFRSKPARHLRPASSSASICCWLSILTQIRLLRGHAAGSFVNGSSPKFPKTRSLLLQTQLLAS
jgi:hypothetical protein